MQGNPFRAINLGVDAQVLAQLVIVNGPLTVAALQGRLNRTAGTVEAALMSLMSAGIVEPLGGSHPAYRCTMPDEALAWLRAYKAHLLPYHLMRG